MKALPAHDAHDGVAPELLPPALGLTVVHHEIGVSEFARRAEIEHAIFHRTFENERGITERAIGDRHRCASDHVVHDLVPDQNANGIGPRIAVDGERDDWFRIADAAGPSGCCAVAELLEARPIDRWNAILRWAA